MHKGKAGYSVARGLPGPAANGEATKKRLGKKTDLNFRLFTKLVF